MIDRKITPKPKGLSAHENKYSLHKMFPAADWLAVEELFLPGFDRYVDFWALRIHVPKGKRTDFKFQYLSIHAIEIKTSIQDFEAEMKTPNKKIGAVEFSNYWSFAAPKGIIDPDELVKGIGYIEFRGSKGKFVRNPQITYLQSPDWELVAALGRLILKG